MKDLDPKVLFLIGAPNFPPHILAAIDVKK